MTDIERDHRFDLPLRTDDQVVLALEDLLQQANLPQLWFIFFDEDDRLTGPFMPGSGYPADPLQIERTADLGDVPAVRILAVRLREIADLVGAASVVLVWERPGHSELDSETRAWVRELARTGREAGLVLRMQLLLHDGGLRMLVPDDFI